MTVARHLEKRKALSGSPFERLPQPLELRVAFDQTSEKHVTEARHGPTPAVSFAEQRGQVVKGVGDGLAASGVARPSDAPDLHQVTRENLQEGVHFGGAEGGVHAGATCGAAARFRRSGSPTR